MFSFFIANVDLEVRWTLNQFGRGRFNRNRRPLVPDGAAMPTGRLRRSRGR
jgi:hypothetical protein